MNRFDAPGKACVATVFHEKSKRENADEAARRDSSENINVVSNIIFIFNCVEEGEGRGGRWGPVGFGWWGRQMTRRYAA